MVNVPVARTSTVLFEDVASIDAAYPPRDGTLSYGRNGTPTLWSLAEALTELEPGAAGTRLYPSGAAAVSFALASVLEPGDELLMVDNAYLPTRTFCDQGLKRYGIATRYYDPRASAAEVEAMLSESTRAIFMESPGSLTFEVQDVPGICAIARQRRITTLLDNTWGTPLFFKPFRHGVDLSIQAGTKYIAGHSDLVIGMITARTDALFRQVKDTTMAFGDSPSPDECYLTLRGLRSLQVRLRQHQASGLRVAQWLQQRLAASTAPCKAWKNMIAVKRGASLTHAPALAPSLSNSVN